MAEEKKKETIRELSKRKILRHVNVEAMDPEEWAWRRRRMKERGEIS